MSDNEQPLSVMQEEIKKEEAMQYLRDAVIQADAPEDPVSLPIFVGAISTVHQQIFNTAILFNAYRDSVAREVKGEKLSEDRTSASLKMKYEESVKETFPEMLPEVLEPMLQNYVRFIYRYTSRLLVRDDNKDIITQKVDNTIPGKDGTRLSIISPLIPSADDSKTPLRDRMRRTLRRSQGLPDTFTIVLLNSLIVMRVSIPTPTDMIRLINKIGTTLVSYGNRFNVSAIHLERAGIAQILVDFIFDRLKRHSVKDVDDINELKRYILANDIDVIAQALLCITSPKGVSFRTYCTASKCSHVDNKIIDPTAMVLEVVDAMPADRRQVLYEITNEGRKLSREELAKWKPVYAGPDGEPLDLAIKIDDGSRFYIDIPNLEEYFGTYERMANRIDPELRQLAVDFPNLKEFKEKRQEYLASIKGSEYLQWFSYLEVDPLPGTEGEKEYFRRSEDPEEFEEGLLANLGDKEEIYTDSLVKLLSAIPRMTYTYIGVSNDICVSCKNSPDQVDRSLIQGFTPIDPIMNFFDRARMMIGTVTTGVSFIEESLS